MTGILDLDARHVFRRLVRTPAVSATVILSLAAGMASVVTLLGVVDTLFFREPAGVRDSSRVVAIGPWAGFQRTSYPDYNDLRNEARSLESVAAFAFWSYSARVGACGDAGTRAARVALAAADARSDA